MILEFSLNTIHDAAKKCWQEIGNTAVVAFHGEMGAGKTTFIYAMCDAKGVTDAVGSPTFSIINEYMIPGSDARRKIFHIDLYRLKDGDEARQAGVEDCLYSGETCLVEWPERAEELLPDDTLHLYIELVDSSSRRLRISRN